MPLEEEPNWGDWFTRFERELARLGTPTGSSGLLWDARPEGMLFLATPIEEWYAPVEEAVNRLSSLEDGAGLAGLRARLADWRGGMAPALAEDTDE